MPVNHLKARLTRGEIILMDGALGTELERRGISTALPLWSAQALLEAPERVREIHEEYAQAGADLLTANTFRTTPRALVKAGRTEEDAEQLTALAVELARKARQAVAAGREIWIAGSIAPLEDCYRSDLAPDPEVAEREHREQALRLARAGVDVILVETMNTISEAVAGLRGALASGLPVLVSFIARNPQELWSGESLSAAVRLVAPLAPDAILVNCVPAETATGCLEEMARATHLPIGCYANAGSPDLGRSTWCFDPEMTPERFADYAGEWIRRGAQMVGGCCGTGPEHVRAVRAALPPVLVE